MISIIVPIYNVEKYLPKCIESILNQTLKNIELILVDDGSEDSCLEICYRFSKQESRIRVIHQENKGVSAARNTGLDIARGEYIGFVDPDDWIAPKMYEEMVNAIQSYDVDMAICGYDYYDEDGNLDEKRRYCIGVNEVITQKDIMNRFADMPPSIRHGVVNKLFKKQLLDNQKFKEDLHSSEDVFFLNEYVQKVKNAVIVHQPYYKNLVRAGSATHGGLDIESLANSFTAHEQMYQDTIRKYPELKDHCLAFLLDVCTLKYNEVKRKIGTLPQNERKKANPYLRFMRKFIKRYARLAMGDKEIYWKTRIAYLILK